MSRVLLNREASNDTCWLQQIPVAGGPPAGKKSVGGTGVGGGGEGEGRFEVAATIEREQQGRMEQMSCKDTECWPKRVTESKPVGSPHHCQSLVMAMTMLSAVCREAHLS